MTNILTSKHKQSRVDAQHLCFVFFCTSTLINTTFDENNNEVRTLTNMSKFNLFSDPLFLAYIVKFLEIPEYTPITTLSGHSKRVNCILYDGIKVYSAGNDNIIRNCDPISFIATPSNNIIVSMTKNVNINSMAFYGNKLFYASFNNNINVRNIETNQLISQLGENTCTVKSMIIVNEKLFVATGNVITVWSVINYNQIAILNNHTNVISWVTHYNNYLISGSYDKTVRIWDITCDNDITCIECLEINKFVMCITITCNKMFLGGFGFIDVYNANTYEYNTTITKDVGSVNSIISSGNKIFSTCYEDIKVWNANTYECITTLIGKIKYSICPEIKNYVTCFEIIKDKLFSGHWNGHIKIWKVPLKTEPYN